MKITDLKNWLNNKDLHSLKKLVFALIIIYLFPKNIFISPDTGVDPSWKLSLNMAINEGLTWGRDIIFTYGPMGYLSTRLSVLVPSTNILLFHLFITANAFYFIYFLIKRIDNWKDLFYIATILFIFGPFIVDRDSITLYFFALFYMFHFLKYNRFFAIFLVSSCTILAFFIKINTGIILNVVFLIFILFIFLCNKRLRFRLFIFLLIHTHVILLFSYILNVEFISYIVNCFPLINSYNDAMVNTPTIFRFLAAVCCVIFTTYPYLLELKKTLKSPFEMFIMLNTFLFLYIIFKQGFVRADLHQNTFFFGVVFPSLLIYNFTSIIRIKKLHYYSILTISIVFIFSINITSFYYFIEPQGFFELINSKRAERLASKKLPTKTREQIGKMGVDVLGYENSYLYENNLSYNPRPIIQSYSAYDSKLIDLNYKKYNSPTAPDFVLYHFGSIDDRHPFWDEPKIYLSLFSHYKIQDTLPENANFDNRLILFKKNDLVKTFTQKIIQDTVVEMNNEIYIPKSDKVLYLSIESEYTTLGKIRRILFQPSLCYVKLHYDDHDSSIHRLILPVMKSGVPINKKVLDYNQAYTFFNTKGNGNVNTTSFSINGESLWVTNKFRLKFIEYSF